MNARPLVELSFLGGRAFFSPRAEEGGKVVTVTWLLGLLLENLGSSVPFSLVLQRLEVEIDWLPVTGMRFQNGEPIVPLPIHRRIYPQTS